MDILAVASLFPPLFFVFHFLFILLSLCQRVCECVLSNVSPEVNENDIRQHFKPGKCLLFYTVCVPDLGFKFVVSG